MPDPEANVTIRLHDGEISEARVVRDLSSKPGSHAAGLTLRLGLRLLPGYRWKTGPAVVNLRTGSELQGRLLVEIPALSPSKGRIESQREIE